MTVGFMVSCATPYVVNLLVMSPLLIVKVRVGGREGRWYNCVRGILV